MRSEKVFRGCRHNSKAASKPPGAAETAPEKGEGFPRLPATLKSRFNAPPEPPKRLRRNEKGFHGSRHLSKAASSPAAPWRSVPQPALLPALSPRVILADHHTYRCVKEVNALKAVADREVIRLLCKYLSSSKQ